MYHEMHEIVYQEAQSMPTGVYILHVWAWEYLPVTQPIYEGAKQPQEPYIQRYSG